MNRYQELLDLIQTFQKDFEKFYQKGNKSPARASASIWPR